MRTPNAARPPRFRWSLIWMSVGLMLVLQSFSVVLSGMSARQADVRHAQSDAERLGTGAVFDLFRRLDPNRVAAHSLAHAVSEGIVDPSSRDFDYYLFEQLHGLPQALGVYIGLADGSYVSLGRVGGGYRLKHIDSGAWKPAQVSYYDRHFRRIGAEPPLDDDYDPRFRPWFAPAAGAPGTDHWSDPYEFYIAGQPGVTVSSAVATGRYRGSVVGVDVELVNLQDWLAEVSEAGRFQAFLRSDGVTIASTESPGWATSTDERGRTTPSPADEEGFVSARVPFPEESWLPWTLTVRTPTEGLLGTLFDGGHNLIGGWLMTSAIVILGALVLWGRSRPIDELAAQAGKDPLTGLANRRGILDFGRPLLETAGPDAPVLLMVLDLDNFKPVNDHFGHDAGDRVLQEVARHLDDLTRCDDLTGRMGGDEFVVVQAVRAPMDARSVADRLVAALQRGLGDHLPQYPSLGVTGGAVVVTTTNDPLEVVLARADALLIAQKVERKGVVRFAEVGRPAADLREPTSARPDSAVPADAPGGR